VTGSQAGAVRERRAERRHALGTSSRMSIAASETGPPDARSAMSWLPAVGNGSAVMTASPPLTKSSTADASRRSVARARVDADRSHPGGWRMDLDDEQVAPAVRAAMAHRRRGRSGCREPSSEARALMAPTRIRRWVDGITGRGTQAGGPMSVR